jgi:hypothetical protein
MKEEKKTVIFDGQNYNEWAPEARFALMEKGLWITVEKDMMSEKAHPKESDEELKKRIEDCKLDVDIPRVDIIISEWMGFCLLFEGMLDSVIYARENFLVKDGLMFPERAKLYLAAADDLDEKVK